MGYTPVHSGLDRNPGWSEALVESLATRADAVFERSGRRLTIIGHSMGGILGLSIAVRRPASIRQVIALGSPLVMVRGSVPESVRFTAIYSRDDRIVRDPAARARDPRARNVEVRGSHVGLAGNPKVYRRLAALLHPGAMGRQE